VRQMNNIQFDLSKATRKWVVSCILLTSTTIPIIQAIQLTPQDGILLASTLNRTLQTDNQSASIEEGLCDNWIIW
jgi:hypothetical protein